METEGKCTVTIDGLSLEIVAPHTIHHHVSARCILTAAEATEIGNRLIEAANQSPQSSTD